MNHANFTLLAIDWGTVVSFLFVVLIVGGSALSKLFEKVQTNSQNQPQRAGRPGADKRRQTLEELAAQRRRALQEQARLREQTRAQNASASPLDAREAVEKTRQRARQQAQRQAQSRAQQRQQQMQQAKATQQRTLDAAPPMPENPAASDAQSGRGLRQAGSSLVSLKPIEEVAVVPSAHAKRIAGLRSSMRQAIVMKELLDPPVGLRDIGY